MGRSCTYHVVGQTKEKVQKDGKKYWFVFTAMNRVEMVQQNYKCIREHGEPIATWSYQTEIGRKILGGSYWHVTAKEIAPLLPKLVECPICKVDGYSVGCTVCNYSGYAKKNSWNKWEEWQLDSIRKWVLKSKTIPAI